MGQVVIFTRYLSYIRDRFIVAGHDRGGRVAHRLALDHPNEVLYLGYIGDLKVTVGSFLGYIRAIAIFTLYTSYGYAMTMEIG